MGNQLVRALKLASWLKSRQRGLTIGEMLGLLKRDGYEVSYWTLRRDLAVIGSCPELECPLVKDGRVWRLFTPDQN